IRLLAAEWRFRFAPTDGSTSALSVVLAHTNHAGRRAERIAHRTEHLHEYPEHPHAPARAGQERHCHLRHCRGPAEALAELEVDRHVDLCVNGVRIPDGEYMDRHGGSRSTAGAWRRGGFDADEGDQGIACRPVSH